MDEGSSLEILGVIRLAGCGSGGVGSLVSGSGGGAILRGGGGWDMEDGGLERYGIRRTVGCIDVGDLCGSSSGGGAVRLNWSHSRVPSL